MSEYIRKPAKPIQPPTPLPLEDDEDLFYVSTQIEIERLTNIAMEELIHQDNMDAAIRRFEEQQEKSTKRLRTALLILISAYYLRGKKHAEDQMGRGTILSPDDITLIGGLAERGTQLIDDIFGELKTEYGALFAEREKEIKNLRTALIRADNRFRMMAGAESMFARNEATLLAFKKAGGVFFVRWIVTEDERLCEKCAPNADRIFLLSEASGKIPLHPYCRCMWNQVTRDELV